MNRRAKLAALAVLAILALSLAGYALMKPSGDGPPRIFSDITQNGPKL